MATEKDMQERLDIITGLDSDLTQYRVLIPPTVVEVDSANGRKLTFAGAFYCNGRTMVEVRVYSPSTVSMNIRTKGRVSKMKTHKDPTLISALVKEHLDVS